MAFICKSEERGDKTIYLRASIQSLAVPLLLLCSAMLLSSHSKYFFLFALLSVLQACCPECREVHTEGELMLLLEARATSRQVQRYSYVALLFIYLNTSCLSSTVQARIQSPGAVCHRLDRQTVPAPVWHREGRICPALQQEYHLDVPAPLSLPFR